MERGALMDLLFTILIFIGGWLVLSAFVITIFVLASAIITGGTDE